MAPKLALQMLFNGHMEDWLVDRLKPLYIRIPKLSGVEVFLLVVPAFRFLNVEIVGQLYFAEIVTIMSIAFFAYFGKTVRIDKNGARFLLMATVWLLVQIATDLYLDIPARDYLRGWSNILLVILGVLALLLLEAGTNRKASLFVLGWAIGGLLQVIIAPTELQQNDPFKWSVGPCVMFMGLVFLSKLQRWNIPATIVGFILLIVLVLATSNRSLAFIMMVTLVVFLASSLFRDWANRTISGKFLVLAPVLASTVIVGLGAFQAYGVAVEAGIFGDRVRAKHERQTASDLGFVLSARSEILISGLVVIDSPIIGHGSWAKDENFSSIYKVLRETTGQGAREVVSEPGLILTHSFLMGAWVHAGIVGAILWITMLGICARVAYDCLTSPNRSDVLVTFLTIFTMWNILFSNLQGESRYIAALCICVVLLRFTDIRRASRDSN